MPKRGELNHQSVLNEMQVKEIRELRRIHGIPYHALAEQYSCSKTAVRKVCVYETWIHVDD